MEANMSLWVLVLTWFCWTSLFGWARDCPLTSDQQHATLGYPAVSFYTESATPRKYPAVSFYTESATPRAYSKFLTNLRSKLKSRAKSYSIPLLRQESKVTKPKRFVMVTLSNSKKSATIAIDVVNVYVVAYRVGASSYFFNDTSTDAFNDLFKGTAKTWFKFSGGYPDLQNLGADRKNVDLGIYPLDNAIYSLNKYSKDDRKIAAPLVVIIQMLSEASRISLIEKKIVDNFHQRFRPSADVLSHENKWSRLSSAIQRSNRGVFQKPVVLKKSNGSLYNVTDVKQIKDRLALLLFVPPNSISSIGHEINSYLSIENLHNWL